MRNASHPITYYQFKSFKIKETNAPVILETSVSLTINGDLWFSFMCTPTDLEALAIGFLYNEGLITAIDEVASVRVCPAGDNVDVWLNHPVEKPSLGRKTSGCTGGITSAVLDTKKESVSVARAGEYSTITVDQINQLIATLFDSQDLYKETGGVHTSILTDGMNGSIIGEDIGRHNTLDKISGKLLQNTIEYKEKFIITTGRISSEMIQKAVKIGATILISRTSPSSLSIEIAQEMGITLIGYARHNQFRLYSHPQRIKEFVATSSVGRGIKE
jgi:FdhD protein